MTKIFSCDKCKKVIENDRFSISFVRDDYRVDPSSDLCEKCAKPLKKYLEDFFNN